MDSAAWQIAGVVSLILASAFFVAAEYSLVGSRVSRLSALAKKGNHAARLASKALESLPPYIAGTQLAITMTSIGLGWLGEGALAKLIEPALSGIGLHVIAGGVAFLSVTFLLVVLGELVPKYLALRTPDRLLLRLIYPLNFALWLLRPLTAILEGAGYAVLRPFGVDIRKQERPIIAKEELAALIRESHTAGEFAEGHARMVTKALRLTELQADDVMIPRVDVVAVDADLEPKELLEKLSQQSHTRVLVVDDGDLDEVVGILHLQDAIRLFAGKVKDLRSIVRPPVFVPVNLSLERLVDMMQEEKTQMLIIRDEHGGTAGLLTLEDIVEEIFGELDDQVEHAQPRIFKWPDGRVIMRGDVRTDELADFLGLEDNPLERETVSTIIMDELDRVPRIGDSIQTDIGLLRVVNMSRQRITRVSLNPRNDIP
jgi:putative hemolysin